MGHNVTARDVPELRADMLGDLRGVLAQPNQFRSPQEMDEIRRWATSLEASELFWVAKDMRLVAEEAAKEMLPLTIYRDDVPSSHGILVWEEVTHGIAGFSWSVAGPKVSLNALVPRDRALALQKERHEMSGGTGFELPGHSRPSARLWWDSDLPIPFGEELTEVNIYLKTMPFDELDQEISRFLPTMAMALWHLLGQTLAAKEIVRPSRAGMKRLARLNVDLMMGTRYITLRHMKPDHYERSDTETGYHYSVRFEVRGHTRTIPDKDNPGQFRKVNVRGHIRGPEGAPMLPSSKKVNVLRK